MSFRMLQKQGVGLMARPPKLTQAQIDAICERYPKETIREIAHAMGIPKSTVNYWTSRFKAQNGLRFNVPECPDCRSLALELTPEFEVVCGTCGTILRESRQSVREIAYEVQTHAPINHLDWDKSQGSFMRRRDYYSVLKNSSRATENLGIRYRQVRNYIDPEDRLRKLLEKGSLRLKQLGLEKNPILGDATGRVLRKIYRNIMREISSSRFLRSSLVSFKHQAVVDSVVAYILETYLDSEKVEALLPRLEFVNEEIVQLTRDLASKHPAVKIEASIR